MDGSSVRFSPHNSFWDCARPVSLVITEYGAILSPSPPLRKQPVPVGVCMEEELDVIVNQPVSLVVDDPKAEGIEEGWLQSCGFRDYVALTGVLN